MHGVAVRFTAGRHITDAAAAGGWPLCNVCTADVRCHATTSFALAFKAWFITRSLSFQHVQRLPPTPLPLKIPHQPWVPSNHPLHDVHTHMRTHNLHTGPHRDIWGPGGGGQLHACRKARTRVRQLGMSLGRKGLRADKESQTFVEKNRLT